MKRFKCVLQSISKVEEYVSMLTTIVLVFVLLMQVVYRKILNNPLAWTEEFARILFIYVTLIGTSILYRKGEHISFDYVADKLIKGKAEVIRKIAVNIVMAIYLIAILQPSFKYIARMNTVPLAGTQLPTGILYISVPVVAILILIQLVGELVLTVGEKLMQGRKSA